MRLHYLKILFFTFSLIWSGTIYACACCGLDNTWIQIKENIREYTGEVLLGLNLSSGDFDDSPRYEIDYPINSVIKGINEFRFKTKQGDIRFQYKDIVEHRMTDITFITNKKYKYSDEADIYHELILHGNLLVPQGVRSSFKPDTPQSALRPSMPATMVFQGIGNGCIEGPEFKKWLIKVDDKNIYFHGYGFIEPKSTAKQ